MAVTADECRRLLGADPAQVMAMIARASSPRTVSTERGSSHGLVEIDEAFAPDRPILLRLVRRER